MVFRGDEKRQSNDHGAHYIRLGLQVRDLSGCSERLILNRANTHSYRHDVHYHQGHNSQSMGIDYYNSQRNTEYNTPLDAKKITQSRWKSFLKTKSSSTRPRSAVTVAAAFTQGGGFSKMAAEHQEKQDRPSTTPAGATTGGDTQERRRPSTSPGHLELSATNMRSKFCFVAENKAEALTQQLKAMERSRSAACRKKFTTLELTGVLTKDLQEMRASVALDTEDTARRKILYNFHWFDDLLADLPCNRDEPKFLSALQKLHALAQSPLAVKRFTKERFYSIVQTLREWELGLPEVNNTIRRLKIWSLCRTWHDLPNLQISSFYLIRNRRYARLK
eukprot:sb/3466579/